MYPEGLVELGVALGLGLLVGMQREWTPSKVAGIRTFALVTLFGTVCGLLARRYGGWIPAAGLVAVAALIIEVHQLKAKSGEASHGMTTETAALLMFAVGVLLTLRPMAPAVAVAGVAAVLLQWKQPLHDVVRKLGERDMRAITRLILIALVILPILPNRTYDPYQVVNPYKIWLMVVLIVGISLTGYIAHKFLGARAGTLLGGFLGGVVSSTATTVGYARRSRHAAGAANPAVAAILIACGVQFARMILGIGLVAPGALRATAPSLAILMLTLWGLGAVFYFTGGREDGEIPDQEDPTNMRAAVVFGLLYGIVLFAVAFVWGRFGREGVYVLSAVSGLTDMDAITLSTSQMTSRGEIETELARRMILLASASNFLFKILAVALLGNRRVFARMVLAAVVFWAATAALFFYA
jgi:uncharacterized membrane protein (DUF4010 family)